MMASGQSTFMVEMTEVAEYLEMLQTTAFLFWMK